MSFFRFRTLRSENVEILSLIMGKKITIGNHAKQTIKSCIKIKKVDKNQIN